MTDKLKAAAQMALEALEWSYGGEPMPTEELKAINAIRQALAEPDMPVDRGAWSDVENATKWVDDLRGDEPDLLNQTCCGCGRSGGFALYCGWCWSKGEHVADVSTSDKRVPNPDKQRQWVGLTTEQRNNIMQKYGNDWKRYTEEVGRQIKENNS